LGMAGNLVYAWQSIAVRASDATITFSQLHRQRLLAHHARMVFTVPEFLPEGVSCPRESTSDFTRKDSREKLLVFAGRLAPEKRAIIVPAVLDQLRRADSDWKAVIFGEGPEWGRVQDAVRKRGLTDCVSFPGFVSWDEVS